MESIQELEAVIAIRDIQYPFEEYKQVALGIPYLRTANGKLRAIRKKVVLKKNRVAITLNNNYDYELEVVAIVGKNFALVPNELVEDMVEKAVNGYGLTILSKKIGKYENSLRIDLLSPMLKREVEVGDIVQFGVSVRNSIDGSSSLAVDAFSYRLKCRNGATARIDTTFSARHIGNPEELVKAFNRALSKALENADMLLRLYQSMSRVKLTREGLNKLIDLKFPMKYYKHLPIAIDNDTVKLTREVSLWHAFNDITYMITHESRASPIARSYMTHRLHRVMQELVA